VAFGLRGTCTIYTILWEHARAPLSEPTSGD
jgi:hypothetical protein